MLTRTLHTAHSTCTCAGAAGGRGENPSAHVVKKLCTETNKRRTSTSTWASNTKFYSEVQNEDGAGKQPLGGLAAPASHGGVRSAPQTACSRGNAEAVQYGMGQKDLLKRQIAGPRPKGESPQETPSASSERGLQSSRAWETQVPATGRTLTRPTSQ